MVSSYTRAATHGCDGDYGWYDARPSKLKEFIDANFDAAAIQNQENTSHSLFRPGQHLLGLIVPHAGLVYSGATAAKAYQHLRHYLHNGSSGGAVQRIFILGPSHHKGFYGVELSAASSYATPFGPLMVDTDIINKLKRDLEESNVPAEMTTKSVDEDEHSIEMQIPYISHILHFAPTAADKSDIHQQERRNSHDTTALVSRVKIVPIIVGSTGARLDEEISNVLRPYMLDEVNVFVFSSDFCHWGKAFQYTYHYEKDTYPVIADSIEAMDHAGMSLIESCDVKGWYAYLTRTSNTICGRNPISIGLNFWSKVAQSMLIQFVGYAQSDRVVSHSGRSVSYAAAAIIKKL